MYILNGKMYNYEVVRIENGKERYSYNNLNEEEVKKVVEDYNAEGAKEIEVSSNQIVARF